MNNNHSVMKSDFEFRAMTAIVAIVLLAGLVLIGLCAVGFISAMQAL